MLRIVETFPIFALLLLQYANGQIPAPCANLESLERHECCPTPDIQGAGPCGSNLSRRRGNCETLSIAERIEFDPSDNVDPRNNWPIQFFNRTCVCLENYGGYDCGECKFGYTQSGDRCVKSTPREIKSFEEFSDAEWRNYRAGIRAAKYTPSRYWILTEYSSDRSVINDSLVNPNVYDYIVWLHIFAARDTFNAERNFIDFAHRSSGFPTWHRLQILFLEREIQNIDGQENFQLFYWNWTNPSLASQLFTVDRLGTSVNGVVTGEIFNNPNWPTFCWNEPQPDYCNPTVPDQDPNDNTVQRRLIRCPTVGTNPSNVCLEDETRYPTLQMVRETLELDLFDEPNYDTMAVNGFRNNLEGSVPVDDPEECATDRFCACGLDATCQCRNEGGCEDVLAPIREKLHTTMHCLLARGDLNTPFADNDVGVMASLTASPNDPAFFAHHLSVDCLHESWLKSHPDTKYPTDPNVEQPEGHRAGDYIVPFYPLYTHEEMFKTADNFGYDCTLFDGLVEASSISVQVSLSLFLSLLVIAAILAS